MDSKALYWVEWSEAAAAAQPQINELNQMKRTRMKREKSVLCVRDVVLLPSKWGDIILSRN